MKAFVTSNLSIGFANKLVFDALGHLIPNSFGTTFGHSDETFQDPVFLNYVCRGILWAAGRSVPRHAIELPAPVAPAAATGR